MRKIELTETERLDVQRAVVSLIHYYEKQAEKHDILNHPTISKRNKLEADKFKLLLDKFR